MIDDGARQTFVGRRAEVTHLRSCIDRAVRGHGSVTLIASDAGIGKTALIRHVVQHSSCPVRWVSVTPSDQARPLGVWLDVCNLTRAALMPDGPIDLIDRLGELPGYLAVEAIHDAFERAGAEGPLCVVIDDAHWADEASVELLAKVSNHVRRLPIAVLVATRMTPEFAKSAAAERLAASTLFLRPFDRDESRAIAANAIGGCADVDSVVTAASGIPLLLTMLARASVTVEVDGLDALVERCCSHSELTGADVLTVLAVSESPRTLGELAAISRVTTENLALLLDQPLIKLVATHDDAGFRLRHDLIRTAILRRTSAVRVQMAHRQVAEVLKDSGRHSELVTHVLGAGIDLEDHADIISLAREVMQSLPASALRLVEALSAAAPRIATSVEVLTLRAQALAATGQPDAADVCIRQLLSQNLERPHQALLHRELALSAVVRGDQEAAKQHMSLATELTDDAVKARAYAELAIALMFARHATEAQHAARAARNHSGSAFDTASMIAATGTLLVVANMSGDVDAANVHAAEFLAMLALPDAAAGRVYLPQLTLAMHHFDAGRGDDVLAAAHTGIADARASGNVWAIPVFDGFIAQVYLLRGRLDDARVHASAAIDGAQGFDSLCVTAWASGTLSEAAALQGDWSAAHDAADLAIAELSAGRMFICAEWGLIQTLRSMFARGRGDDLCTGLTLMWDFYGELPLIPSRDAMALCTMSVALQQGDRTLAERVYQEARQRSRHPLAPLRDQERDAFIVGDAAGMLACSRAFEQEGNWHAALNGLERYRSVYPGSGRDADALDRRIVQLTGGGDGTSRSETSQQQRPHRRLTTAERAVAVVLVQGLSSSEIADHLRLSRRTVESHIASMYRKLEVKGRVALARRITEELDNLA